MDDNTLQVILARFDKLDSKIDTAIQQHADMRVEVALLKRESSDRRVRGYIRYAVTFLIAALGAWFGVHVPVGHGK